MSSNHVNWFLILAGVLSPAVSRHLSVFTIQGDDHNDTRYTREAVRASWASTTGRDLSESNTWLHRSQRIADGSGKKALYLRKRKVLLGLRGREEEKTLNFLYFFTFLYFVEFPKSKSSSLFNSR